VSRFSPDPFKIARANAGTFLEGSGLERDALPAGSGTRFPHLRAGNQQQFLDPKTGPSAVHHMENRVGIPFRTSGDIERETKQQTRMLSGIKWFFFLWAVVVPLVVLILDKLNVWVGWMVFTFSLWKIAEKTLKLTGKWKKSPKQLAEEEDKREMQHHHYHCKLNPQGFLRLKLANFEREARERTRVEAESLKRKS
jgi:hypothetical protein